MIESVTGYRKKKTRVSLPGLQKSKEDGVESRVDRLGDVAGRVFNLWHTKTPLESRVMEAVSTVRCRFRQ